MQSKISWTTASSVIEGRQTNSNVAAFSLASKAEGNSSKTWSILASIFGDFPSVWMLGRSKRKSRKKDLGVAKGTKRGWGNIYKKDILCDLCYLVEKELSIEIGNWGAHGCLDVFHIGLKRFREIVFLGILGRRQLVEFHFDRAVAHVL